MAQCMSMDGVPNYVRWCEPRTRSRGGSRAAEYVVLKCNSTTVQQYKFLNYIDRVFLAVPPRTRRGRPTPVGAPARFTGKKSPWQKQAEGPPSAVRSYVSCP